MGWDGGLMTNIVNPDGITHHVLILLITSWYLATNTTPD